MTNFLKTNHFFFISVFKNHIFKYPSPLNLSYFWNFGFISMIFFFIQLVTGILLAMHYCSDANYAFNSIEHILRNVNMGWLLKFMHANGASFFFLTTYFHIWRNLYYRKYNFINKSIWITGLCLFFLMIITAFLGYVLPWGQMSFWAATVITNLISAIPIIGTSIVYWLWGGYAVGNPTLSRFFSLHYLLPFIILFFIFLHFIFLHKTGSTNPSFISSKLNRHYISLYPYYALKDFIGLFILLIFYSYIIFFFPDFLVDTNNYIKANPLVTPTHILPEWYFLPFYAILRAIPSKIVGILTMLFSILLLFFLPFFDYFLLLFAYTDLIYNPFFNRNLIPFIINIFVCNFILLGWLGAQNMEEPFNSLSFYLLLTYFFLIFFFSFYLPPYYYFKLKLFSQNTYFYYYYLGFIR